MPKFPTLKNANESSKKKTTLERLAFQRGTQNVQPKRLISNARRKASNPFTSNRVTLHACFMNITKCSASYFLHKPSLVPLKIGLGTNYIDKYGKMNLIR